MNDLVNINNEELEKSDKEALETGPYITDNGNYYANNKMYKIDLGASSCDAIINDTTPFPEGVYRPVEPGLVKVKKISK